MSEVEEVQIKKPKGKNKWLVPIIVAGGLVLTGITLFFLFGGTGGAINFPLIPESGKTGEPVNYSLIPVSNNDNRWGYINRKGDYVINPQFEDADFFSKDGLAKIRTGGKTGYINKKGEYIIPANYKSGTAFNDGLAFVVMEGGIPSCIDKKGNVKFELATTKWVSAFNDGLAIFVTEKGEYGYIDKIGNIAINAQFERACPFKGNFARIWQKGDVGFIDKTGKIVISPQFKSVGNFNEEKASFYNGKQWGFVNPKGTYAINPQFDYAGTFSNGLAAVGQGRFFGFIDKEGKLKINPQFEKASSFSDGLAAVQVSGGKYAYINIDGKYEINPQFETAGNFYKGTALVRSADKWGIINKKGQYVVNPQFQQIKLEAYVDSEHNTYFVENDYYDTFEFTSNFFKRAMPGSFDGFNASSTLQTLLDNKVYGDEVDASDEYQAIYNKPQRITDDISIITTSFNFGNPIYSFSNYGKEYHFSEKMIYLKYRLEITGKAANHASVIIESLKAEIEKRYRIEMEKTDGIHDISFYGYDDQSKTDFIIIVNGNTYTLFVGFEKGVIKYSLHSMH